MRRGGVGRCPKSLRRGRPWSPLTRTCGVKLPATRLGLLADRPPTGARVAPPDATVHALFTCCTRWSLQTAHRSQGSRPPGFRVPAAPRQHLSGVHRPSRRPTIFISGAALVSRSLCEYACDLWNCSSSLLMLHIWGTWLTSTRTWGPGSFLPGAWPPTRCAALLHATARGVQAPRRPSGALGTTPAPAHCGILPLRLPLPVLEQVHR